MVCLFYDMVNYDSEHSHPLPSPSPPKKNLQSLCVKLISFRPPSCPSSKCYSSGWSFRCLCLLGEDLKVSHTSKDKSVWYISSHSFRLLSTKIFCWRWSTYFSLDRSFSFPRWKYPYSFTILNKSGKEQQSGDEHESLDLHFKNTAGDWGREVVVL